MSRRWTAEEERRLRQLHGDGANVGEAAAELGRGYGGVHYTARRLGLRFPLGHAPNLERNAAVIDLLGVKHLSVRRAARQLQCSAATVAKMARRLARAGLLRHEHGRYRACG